MSQSPLTRLACTRRSDLAVEANAPSPAARALCDDFAVAIQTVEGSDSDLVGAARAYAAQGFVVFWIVADGDILAGVKDLIPGSTGALVSVAIGAYARLPRQSPVLVVIPDVRQLAHQTLDQLADRLQAHPYPAKLLATLSAPAFMAQAHGRHSADVWLVRAMEAQEPFRQADALETSTKAVLSAPSRPRV